MDARFKHSHWCVDVQRLAVLAPCIQRFSEYENLQCNASLNY